MLPLLVFLCVLLSTGSAETLWFPVPLLTDYEFSHIGGDPTDSVTTYVATATYTSASTPRFILPGGKIFLAKASDIAVARVPILGVNVEYSCRIGSDDYAQCVRNFPAGTHTANDVYSWTTSVCAATTVPPGPPTPAATGESTPTNVATPSKESPWLPCPTSNDPTPTYAFVRSQWYLYSAVSFVFMLPGFFLFAISRRPAPVHKGYLTHWDAPPIERSLIHVPSPSRFISPVWSDDRREGSPMNNPTDVLPGQSSSNHMSSSPASDPQTPSNTPLETSHFSSADVQEPLETPTHSAEVDLLAPRTTSVSAFCTQVMSSSIASDMTIEGIETRLSRRSLKYQHFLLLMIRHESRWAYLRIDMMGNLHSPSTLPDVDAPRDETDGPTIRIFDNQTPEAKELLLDQEMSTVTFYATRWTVEYPDLNPADISQLRRLKSRNPAHHYQFVEIGPEKVTSSKTPTLQDFARVLQLLEREVAPLARHPILRSLVPVHAALLWTIIPRTVLLAAYRPQWLIYHHRLSVENLPHIPFHLRSLATFVPIIPLIAFLFFFFKERAFGKSFFAVAMLSTLSFVSTMALKVLIPDVMIGRWRRRWDARAGILLSSILERIESRPLEESTLSRTEAIDLYHPHATEQQHMHVFRLEPIPTSSATYNVSGLGIGLSLSSHIILEPVPVCEFFPEDVLEPRQTTLGQFCADLRVDRRGSAALIEAVSWRKSRKQPFRHEFVLLLVRHGVQYYTVRIDRRGKLNKALDGLLLSGNAMEVVTIDHWQQRNYRALDLFNEHEESDPVVTLVSWHFDLPWLTDPRDPELATLAMQQSRTAIHELFQLGDATQLTTSRRPKLGDLVVLWETMGREAPRYILPSYNCYWQSRTMTFLIARSFPREFILRERNLPIMSIRQLHTRSFVVGDFWKHWRPWYGMVGWVFSATTIGAMWLMIADPVTGVSFAFGFGNQFYDLYYPGHLSLQAQKNRWISDLGSLFGSLAASAILTLGPLLFMSWNMTRATKRMWSHVRPTDEVAAAAFAEVDLGDGLPHLDPISKRQLRKTKTFLRIFWIVRVISCIAITLWVVRFIVDKALTNGINRRQKMEDILNGAWPLMA